MRLKPKIAACSVMEALEAIEIHSDADRLWRAKAITLLKLVGEPGIDAEKHAALCDEHAEKGLKL